MTVSKSRVDGQIADKMAKQHIQNRKPVQEDIIEEPGSIHEWQILGNFLTEV